MTLCSKRHLSIEAKALLFLIENIAPLYLYDAKESVLNQVVLNITKKKLSQNGLTLYQHTEQK